MTDPHTQNAPPRPSLARLHHAGHWFRRAALAWLDRARGGEYGYLLFVAALIGLLCGLGAIAFDYAIRLFQDGFWQTAEPVAAYLRELPKRQLLLAPALGGLLVGLITTFFVSEARGHGVPEVMKAVALHGGVIRGRVAFAKTLTSAITIGSGGSAGREGPIIQIGAAIGSRLGQALGMSKRRLRTLVGCGAAAGIAATFNAPIAGALFAAEVILGEFGAEQFGPIVVSSVVSTAVARGLRGDLPTFHPPACTFSGAWEFLPYVVLGLLCGLVSLAYIRLNQGIGDLFSRARRLPAWLRPAIGGLLVGAMALLAPHIMGDGHWLVDRAAAGHYSIQILLLLVLVKIVATATTLGSGGSGGVFSPALSIGALLGAAVGSFFAPYLGDHFGGVAAYAMVGMAGLISGSMLAPLTAILMVFEITSSYNIILPVMLVAILSTVLAGRANGGLSIYTLRLAREGVQLFRGRSADLLQSRRVADHYRPAYDPIRADASAQQLMDHMLGSNDSQYFVTDAAQNLLGAITLSEARRLLVSPPDLLAVLSAEDAMRRDIPHVTPADTLSTALARFASTHLQELPVVQSAATPRLLGTLAYSDVLAAYQEEILHADAPQLLSRRIANLTRHPVAIAPGFALAEWEPPAAYHGKTLAETRLPDSLGVRVLLVKHAAPDGRPDARVPNARTLITPGDILVLLGKTEAVAHALSRE